MVDNLRVLIVGQGLAGTLLSWHLIKNGVDVVVADDNTDYSASRIAGGLINPVTGKRLVKTWMIDELLPEAMNTYRHLEDELGIGIVTETTILDFHRTYEEAAIFKEKQADLSGWLQHGADDSWQQYFHIQRGIGIIQPSAFVDGGALTSAWRRQLMTTNRLWECSIAYEQISVRNNHIEIEQKRFSHIIFCEGQRANENPWFKSLPWSVDKGEALIAQIQDLPRTHIYKNGITIVPWRNNLFWIGASHDWKATEANATEAFRLQTITLLNEWLKIPFAISNHIVAMRPANFDRKPFTGFHPTLTNIGIFNGLGGKGFSLAPWFARNLASHICNGTPILPAADVRRYERLLTRKNP